MQFSSSLVVLAIATLASCLPADTKPVGTGTVHRVFVRSAATTDVPTSTSHRVGICPPGATNCNWGVRVVREEQVVPMTPIDPWMEEEEGNKVVLQVRCPPSPIPCYSPRPEVSQYRSVLDPKTVTEVPSTFPRIVTITRRSNEIATPSASVVSRQPAFATQGPVRAPDVDDAPVSVVKDPRILPPNFTTRQSAPIETATSSVVSRQLVIPSPEPISLPGHELPVDATVFYGPGPVILDDMPPVEEPEVSPK